MAQQVEGKPDWASAPSWANWLAMDANGIWWWYENEPVVADSDWHDREWGRLAKAGRDERKWRETLEQRPAVQVKE